jgi:serine/threonine-protein kinase
MQTIAHFNILERLGTGALGDVFRARDLKVGRTVALMKPPAELVREPADRARFLADARAAVALNHPNIATLFDVVEQDGECYLAYEFAAGPSLRDEMGGRAVNVRRALEIAAQIGDALAEGHSRSLVHGDLRPDNVVVTPKGSVKVLNFGLTRWTTGGRARAAAASPDAMKADPLGVAGYLSPEQAIGNPIDQRSDVFSLGIILQEMITGRNPFAGDTPSATVMNVMRAQPQPLPSSAPAELASLVTRALSKTLDGRPQGALMLSSELRRIGHALDARDGNAPKTELIPPAKTQSSGAWIAVLIVISLAAIVWWFVF